MTTKTSSDFSWRNVRLVPILHNRMEFAREVRRQFLEFDPDLLALEFPETLKDRVLQGVRRLPLLSVVHYQERDETLVYLVLEPTDGQLEALRLALARDIPVHFIDRDTEAYPQDLAPMPDPYAVSRVGYDAFCRAYLDAQRGNGPDLEDVLREKTMAFHLQRLSGQGRRILFVCGLAHLGGIRRMLEQPQTEVIGRRKREGIGLAHLDQDSSREILSEMPYLAAAYERAREHHGAARLDRLELQAGLVREALESHRKTNKEELTPLQLRVMNRFSRNYALLSGRLVPDFYQLIVSARGAADDDFAYELWQLGSDYPWQSEEPGLPVLRLRGEDLFLDHRRIRFHRSLKTLRRRLVPVPVKRRRREKQPGEWKREFGKYSICSYPPEDVVIEGYGRYLQKRALEIKSEENLRLQPFVASMLDGPDIRETIRQWARGEIFVREARPLRGKVGSVVVVFDPDYAEPKGEEAFPWCVTWLGEHDQESDMAFYSTPAGEVMDGPGISRCQYGGFMLTYPPMRVYDIWKDPFFGQARNKPERLLMAALDYAVERHVVYVSGTPPSGWCQSMASRLGKKLIYLPIGIFSPVTLRKIRQFHVLDGHHVRRYARDFIA